VAREEAVLRIVGGGGEGILGPVRKPPKLCPGDRVAAVTLSFGGPGAFPARYEAGKRQLEAELGLTLVEMPNARRDPQWIAANPKARADDLCAAFADPSIRAVIATVGGDDSIRTLPFVDLEVLRANPKPFLGYSDSTVTHFACMRAGLVSFYGPSVMAGFAENGGMFRYLVESVKRALFATEAIGYVAPNQSGWTAEFLTWADPANQERRRTLRSATGWRWLQGSGISEGPLIGGCADVLEFLKGTPYWPNPRMWDGSILFLETSEEAPTPESFQRWMRNYGAQGILHRLAGILLGRPGGASFPVEDHARYDEALLRVVRTELGLAELPIVTGMDFGHTDPFFVLPYGVRARIDCDARRFAILEPAVCERE
jgi:muramoyltetrapeptide carboxypeptidase LdcA involved in peptidoglycan recycling